MKTEDAIQERLEGEEKPFLRMGEKLAEGERMTIIQDVLIDEFGFRFMEMHEYIKHLKEVDSFGKQGV